MTSRSTQGKTIRCGEMSQNAQGRAASPVLRVDRSAQGEKHSHKGDVPHLRTKLEGPSTPVFVQWGIGQVWPATKYPLQIHGIPSLAGVAHQAMGVARRRTGEVGAVRKLHEHSARCSLVIRSIREHRERTFRRRSHRL